MLWPAYRIRLFITPSHYHHCANLSVDIELMNVWEIYFVECVSKIEHIHLVIHYSIYGAVCFQFTQFPRDGWDNILLCLIIIIKSEVWTIIHCLGLGHESMVCAVCRFIFLWHALVKHLLNHVYLQLCDIWIRYVIHAQIMFDNGKQLDEICIPHFFGLQPFL